MKQTIGKFLATLRKAKGLTQEEVAEKLNISNKTLSSWETDRTTPDAFTLPAIADLYDVTVDEILRGEKAKSNEQTHISEKAKLSLTKKKYGKFSIKHYMFTAFGLLSIILNILGFAFLVYTAISEWVGILLSIVGFCGVVTLTILLIFFERTTLFSEGMIDGDDLSEDSDEKGKGNSLALCIKHKNSISLKLFSLPYLIFSIVTLIILIASGGIYEITLMGTSLIIDRTSIFIGFICASAIMGLTYLIWGICIGLIALKKYSNETQFVAYKKNKKLFSILSVFCSSIIVLFSVAPIVFSFTTIDMLNTMWIEGIEETKTHTKDFEKFRESSQTLILDDETVARFELPSNIFILQLPENWQEEQMDLWTDLGNGFYGTLYDDYENHFCPYKIMYKYYQTTNEVTGEPLEDPHDVLYTVAEGTIIKVYHDKNHNNYDYVLYLPTHILEQHGFLNENGEMIYEQDFSFLIRYTCGDYVGKNFSTGEYGLFHFEHYYVEQFAWFCFVIIACVTLGTHSLIYLLKRKKMSYKI